MSNRSNRRRYAIGKNAIAECQRSGQKMRYQDLVEDGHIPGLLVHPDWYEPRHPQELPVDGSDAIALYRPSPEISVPDGEFGTQAQWAAYVQSLCPTTPAGLTLFQTNTLGSDAVVGDYRFDLEDAASYRTGLCLYVELDGGGWFRANVPVGSPDSLTFTVPSSLPFAGAASAGNQVFIGSANVIPLSGYFVPQGGAEIIYGGSFGQIYTAVPLNGVAPYTYSFSITQDTLFGLRITNDFEVAITNDAAEGGIYPLTISCTITDDAGSQFQMSIPVTVTVPNLTFGELLVDLGVTHYWPMDEASGVMVDQGTAGSANLTIRTNENYVWREAPGISSRGALPVYGLWRYGAPNPIVEAVTGGLPVLAGWTTGGMGVWFRAGRIYTQPMTLISAVCTNNASLSFSISIETSGAIRSECRNSTGVISIETAASYVTPGMLYYVHVDQPADGNGLRLFVNGVELALSTGVTGTATINSWMADMLVASAPLSDIRLGGITNLGAESGFIGSISQPYIARNVSFSAQTISNLWLAAQQTAAPSDVHEFISDLAVQPLYAKVWTPGYYGLDNALRNLGIGDFLMSAASTVPVLDNAGPGLQIESVYRRYKLDYPSTSATVQSGAGTNWEPTAGKTTGAISVVITANGCANTVRKTIWAHGTGVTTALEFSILGTAFGWVLNYRARVGGTVLYEVNSTVISNGGGPDFGMMTVQQPGDGSGPRLYWNGADVTDTVVTSTEPDRWIHSYGDTAAQRWGGAIGAASFQPWNPGQMHDMLQVTRVMTDAQLLALWDAYNGIFNGPVPPYI